jgi:CheY-like chemotaxis protein
LCVNARDAIPGAGKITIETKNAVLDETYCAEHTGACPGEYVMLVVSDNGNGMDKQTMDRIFEPFFTTKGLGEGTGLGLATVYGIVKQNEGYIDVHSEPEHGTAFKIFLPRQATIVKPVDMDKQSSTLPRGHETILLVEDESVVLDLAKAILESLGYAVITATTPGEAIRIAGEDPSRIHLLLTDMIMPEMQGPELVKRLRPICPELKCLYMSGYAGSEFADHIALVESGHFIQKPFTSLDLAVKVRKVLDS